MIQDLSVAKLAALRRAIRGQARRVHDALAVCGRLDLLVLDETIAAMDRAAARLAGYGARNSRRRRRRCSTPMRGSPAWASPAPRRRMRSTSSSRPTKGSPHGRVCPARRRVAPQAPDGGKARLAAAAVPGSDRSDPGTFLCAVHAGAGKVPRPRGGDEPCRPWRVRRDRPGAVRLRCRHRDRARTGPDRAEARVADAGRCPCRGQARRGAGGNGSGTDATPPRLDAAVRADRLRIGLRPD